MALNLTDNWQMAKILTDNWHLPPPPHPDPLSDEDNSISRTDNFVNVNVFDSVTSSRVLSYRK